MLSFYRSISPAGSQNQNSAGPPVCPSFSHVILSCSSTHCGSCWFRPDPRSFPRLLSLNTASSWNRALDWKLPNRALDWKLSAAPDASASSVSRSAFLLRSAGSLTVSSAGSACLHPYQPVPVPVQSVDRLLCGPRTTDLPRGSSASFPEIQMIPPPLYQEAGRVWFRWAAASDPLGSANRENSRTSDWTGCPLGSRSVLSCLLFGSFSSGSVRHDLATRRVWASLAAQLA